MTQYIIGYGMGRCGTLSLAHLLSLQPDSKVSHEISGLHWLTIFSDYPRVREALLRRAEKYQVVGDINYAWVQYIPRIIEDFPDVKFIHIWRDKEETVESFWKLNQARIEAMETTSAWSTDMWYTVHPFLGYPPSKDQIATTYEVFHKAAYGIMWRHPKRTYTLEMKGLNETDSMKLLLDYVGISSQDQVIKKVQVNKGGQSPVMVNVVPRGDMSENYIFTMKAGITLKASDESTVRVD